MSDTEQTLEQELKDRLAEYLPARQIPYLLGIKNLQHMFGLKQQKDRDDHALEMEALGSKSGVGGEDDMGNISVAGDTTITNHYTTSEPPVKESKPAEAGKEAPSLARTLLPLALATGIGAGGLWLYENLSNFKWPGVPDTAYEVRFYNADGELIEVPRHTESSQ